MIGELPTGACSGSGALWSKLFPPDAEAPARTTRVLAATFAASAKQYEIVGYDLGHIFFLTRRLVVPRARLQSAFDVDFATLFQVLAGNFREPLPEHHIVPLGAVLPLAIFALEALVGRQRDLRLPACLAA